MNNKHQENGSTHRRRLVIEYAEVSLAARLERKSCPTRLAPEVGLVGASLCFLSTMMTYFLIVEIIFPCSATA